MDNKFNVSLEAARMLKEKGYPIEKDTPICNKYGDVIGCYPADRPTKAEAIDWLESKGMLVWTEPTCEDIWMWFIISPLHFEDNAETNGITYPTRLKAEEAAIIKALELL